ncbi:PRD domain-containing protein [Anaerotalea alkaliphila]|uniref:PRD domain-containing protein n=1 Tax=Anaerotalea alkaliphila TaxID=2662126 RepID=A0A7X5HX75_9FIRM|nr:PRD domain-containing protein [Anaerotalea alkaliphila]
MDYNYEILRVFNNNVILARNPDSHREAVLVGKGIGFGRRPGTMERFSPEVVEKSFLTYDGKWKGEYLELVEQMEEQVLALCAEIILEADRTLGPLNQRVHIVLTDHIGFALERIRSGMEIHNPFLDEIRILYPEEYEMGLKAQDMIRKNTGIRIVDDEVGFIALHLNAARQQKEVREAVGHTRLVKELVEVLEQELGCVLEKDLSYSRLVHHLRGAVERAAAGRQVKNPLLEALKRDLRESFGTAEKLKEKIKDTIGVEIPEDEVGYMAIHIERLKRNIGNH